jgi:hypothetical protein
MRVTEKMRVSDSIEVKDVHGQVFHLSVYPLIIALCNELAAQHFADLYAQRDELTERLRGLEEALSKERGINHAFYAKVESQRLELEAQGALLRQADTHADTLLEPRDRPARKRRRSR